MIDNRFIGRLFNETSCGEATPVKRAGLSCVAQRRDDGGTVNPTGETHMKGGTIMASLRDANVARGIGAVG